MSRPVSSYTGKVNISASRPWVNVATGKPLKSSKRKKKALKIIVDNKLRGAYAESDLDKGIIRVNKKQHYKPNLQRITPAKDGHEKMYATVHHELLHFKHPNMTERNIRKMEKKDTSRMSPKQKRKLLAKIQK